VDEDMHRNVVLGGVFIALTIGAALWQVLRTLSRGGMSGVTLVRLTCNLILLGIMLYVGYTALTLWT
jgi:hypothetical protein